MGSFFAHLKEIMAKKHAFWCILSQKALAMLTAATHASLVDECFRQGLFRHIHELQLAMLPQPAQVPIVEVFVRAGVCLLLTANMR